MSKERRKSENAALRELVGALKNVINARDALWSLGLFDRIFRFDKCREIFNEYDAALLAVRNAVHGVIVATTSPEEQIPGDAALELETEQAAEHAASQNAEKARQTAITLEEFAFLLGKPHAPRKPVVRGKKKA
ncbi:MAG: hypothetical protein DELT_01290 [Desulfovibrio sp.]